MKTRTKPIIALIAALLLSLLAGCFLALPGALTASAVAAPSLFLPGSYEEYLPLSFPTDAAMTEDYIAVADGSTLYLYDRSEGSYTAYTHRGSLSKLAFTSDGRLFFSDQNAQLYRYDFSRGEAILQENVPCATFLIAENTLYTAAIASNSTTLYAIPCDSTQISFDRAVLIDNVPSPAGASPRLAYESGILYCAFNHQVYGYAHSETGYSREPHYLAGSSTDVTGLSAFISHEGDFYYTVNGTLERDGLYRTVLDGSSVRLFAGSGFVALLSYNGTLYAVQNGSVRAFALSEDAASLTGYEIGAGSDALNRISDAGETVRAGDLLVIADEGNRRVLVYDSSSESYTAYPTDGIPACVATDGDSFAVSVGNVIYVYDRGESEPRYTHTAESTVSGITSVYGTYYYVTEHSYYGIAEEGVREFPRSGTSVPVGITSDLLGNIYVATAVSPGQTALVYRYTESEFMDYAATGTQVEGFTLPGNFCSLRADYEGNLYYLSGSALYQNGARLESFDVSAVLYHGGAAAPSPVSFALSFEDGTVYLNYGDFLLSVPLSFPNLGAVPAGGLYEQLRTPASADALSYVSVAEGAVGVAIDLTALNSESTAFSYASHSRIKGGSALVLGETEEFLLIAVYEDHAYTVMLVPEANCTPVLASAEEGSGTYFISSDVSLTSNPLVLGALTLTSLPRGTAVTLLHEVTPPSGPAYAEVSYGEGGRGYIPLSYLSTASPDLPENDSYSLAYLKADADGVTFYAADDRNNTVRVTDRIQVKVYEAENGALNVCFTDEAGTLYTAQVTEDMLEAGGEDALRISIIIILCVIAVGIGAAYVLLVPKKNKK